MSLRRRAATGGLLLLVPFLGAWECESSWEGPTPVACGSQETSCLPNERLACISDCRPMPPGSASNPAAAEGERCVVDECDAAAWAGSGPPYACPDGLACLPDAPGAALGRCRDQQPGTYTLFCDASVPPSCESGDHCRPFEALPMSTTPPRCPAPWAVDFAAVGDAYARGGGTLTGFCVTPAREGGRCDGDYGTVGACLPCEQGARCADLGTGFRCYRSCQTDADCGCGAGGATIPAACQPDPSRPGEGLCAAGGNVDCIPPRGLCEPGDTCCLANEGFGCRPNAVGQDECCLAPDARCEADGQCCTGSFCIDRRCQTCDAFAPSRTGDSDGCCPGFVSRPILSGAGIDLPRGATSADVGQEWCLPVIETDAGDPCNATATPEAVACGASPGPQRGTFVRDNQLGFCSICGDGICRDGSSGEPDAEGCPADCDPTACP